MFLLLARLISVRKAHNSQGWSQSIMAKSLQESFGITKGEEVLDLRYLRAAQGLSLDDISRATKISVKNLEAMENSDFHLLPPPVYTRAYFKSYAGLLGADEKKIADRYEKSLAVSVHAGEEDIEDVPESGSYFSKKMIVNASLVLVLCVVGYIVYSYYNFQVTDVSLDVPLPMTSHRSPPVADLKNSNAPENPITGVPDDLGKKAEIKLSQTEVLQASGVSVSTTVSEKKEPTKVEQVNPAVVKPGHLVIIAREKTWLRIKEDQKNAYQLLMQPGERIERSALQYDIDIGNAGGVSIQYQGNIMKTLGISGEVVHLHLP